ncbi:MAG: PQQ-dependent sugar dehydrogenase [Verrucomicrobiota bacterium]
MPLNLTATFPTAGFKLFAAVLATGTGLQSQNYFADRIPVSELETYLLDVAVIPDYSTNSPPRMSVMTTDPSGRYFLNDQRGPLYLIEFNPDLTTTVTEYLDLRSYSDLDLRTSSGEQGFQAFAFHPDFFNSGTDGYGRFYTIHSSDDTSQAPDFNPGGSTVFHTLLLEWRTEDPTAGTFTPVPGQPAYRELIRFKQPYGNHNAGLIAFNPTVSSSDADYGNLYIAIGDGGSGGDPQENGEDNSNPYGAILRINPTGSNSSNGAYGIVSANILASDGNSSTLAEIYCYGLRNPQRFGWDIDTGEFYIADIGQNAVEEINEAANGANFGWDLREGSFAFESSSTSGLTDPVAEYDHTNPVNSLPTNIGNRAATVGEVARSTDIPGMNGQLLFGDFPTGLFFIIDVDNDPLNGGQDGIRELQPNRPNGEVVPLIDLINEVRSSRSINTTTRTDLRFSVNTPGRIFVLNKQDGILRELVAPPSIGVNAIGADQLQINFTGTLQESTDLVSDSFENLVPQPESPTSITPSETQRFYRSVVE